ncbi:2'-5' RNA ligase family protein [Caulobacter sp. 17J65-9]|uniref:2'-5' RNA ligase family protein n=1 Tax=Caulobacter sp. 17J65-9 TaxID=2709382 RepID=UPI0013CD96A4|nr:2'-5' RNA ligase family protein [Caulobacter sp. 17J65-9]NEX91717.1 2'-5' RNA ligase family protein [Caulobacter sp. 17J65-9]
MSAAVLAAVALACAAVSTPAVGKGDQVVAIDILLEPDAAMIDRAQALNARLRENYPKGYTLGAGHAPHVTLVQRYVRAADLDKVAAAVSEATRSGAALPIELKAARIDSVEWAGVGVVVLLMDRSPELLALESAVVQAVEPFAVSGGGADAFVQTPGQQINAETIKYVETFVPASSGERYIPHVTAGTAQLDYVAKLKAEPFQPFTFHGETIAIYHLGNFGTAQKRLWTLKR